MEKSFEEITEIAKRYLEKAGYPWVRIDSINPQEKDQIWIVKIIMGISEHKLKTLKIKDETGAIVGFQ